MANSKGPSMQQLGRLGMLVSWDVGENTCSTGLAKACHCSVSGSDGKEHRNYYSP